MRIPQSIAAAQTPMMTEFARAVAFLYLLHTENGQFGGVGLNLAELLSQAPHIRSQLAL